MSAEREERLPRAERLQGQTRLIRLAVSSSVSNAMVGGLSALFLLGLGATPFYVGLLATLGNLDKIVRLGGVRLMPRLGKVGLLFWGRMGALVPAVVLVALAATGRAGVPAVWAALGVLALRGMLNQAGNTAWWPLMQDNTAGDALGAFLARMRLQQRSLEIVLPLAVGWYLGTHPSSQRFALPFALGLVATGAGGWFVRGASERPMSRPVAGLWQRLFEAMRLPPIRRYSFYLMVHSFLHTAAFPFWVVVLTGRGMAAIYFVWMTSVLALGNVCGLFWWGRLVDRHGSRSALTIALVLEGVLGLAWLGLPSHPSWLIVWAAAVYLVWGVLEGGLQMGQNRAMLDAVPAEYQGEGFTLVIYASAFGGGVAGVLGGAAFQWASQSALALAGQEPALLYLAGMQLALLGNWYLSTLLTGYDQQTPVRALIRQALISLRKRAS